MIRLISKFLLALLASGYISLWGSIAHAKDLKVIATIKPLYSLVASVMGNKGALNLMVNSGLDPHIYRLKPSNIRQIHDSDVIFYIDPELEVFLKRALNRPYKNFTAIPLARQDGIYLIPYRTNKIWYQDHGSEKPHEEANGQSLKDLHIWLNPANARRMVEIIEETLSRLDPANSLTYIQNSRKTITRIYNMEEDIREKLRPLREKSMIVYHDAFQYFERSFALKSVGAIILKPDQSPSIKHIKQLKKIAKEKNVTCVLGTPGAHPRIATVVMSGTNAGFGIVDPLGLYIDKGPDLYFEMMTEITQSIMDCQEKNDMLDDLNNLD